MDLGELLSAIALLSDMAGIELLHLKTTLIPVGQQKQSKTQMVSQSKQDKITGKAQNNNNNKNAPRYH